jgi:hypothetical protein
MPRGVMYWALRTALVTVGQLAGTLVASLATPASDWLPPAFFFFLPLPLTPCAEVPTLGLLASLLPGAAGECHARPSVALSHLSARLSSAETSWTSWVASFSSIFSSRTPWRNATITEALEIRGMVLRTWENRWMKERRDSPGRYRTAWRSVSLPDRA